MKDKITKLLSEELNKPFEEILPLIEIPPKPELGDYSFPCFQIAKELKKNPVEIAKDLSKKINSSSIERVTPLGPYVNFFVKLSPLANQVVSEIIKKGDDYGKGKTAKGERIVIDLSSPNIAKPFGIGHLRSTIIGSSIANISRAQGAKVTKMNYLGDWGTQFGKLISAFNEFGDKDKLKNDPINYLYSLYVKANTDETFEDKGREAFVKLEKGDKKSIQLWKTFKDLSLKDFNEIYTLLNVKFDVLSGESEYNKKLDLVVSELRKKKILVESQGALVVDLSQEGLGVCLIQKSDGTTLYATRDIAAAIDRQKKFKATRLFYEVGAEQNLHFKQLFSVLSKMGYGWANNCVHVAHGLYLDKDGKKFSTRKGKTVFMKDVLNETIDLAKNEVSKRDPSLSEKELEDRARAIARSAIVYGDLKSYREQSTVFDLEQFLSFEGNTGPYLLYTYARARNILRKANYLRKPLKISSLTQKEKPLVFSLMQYPDIVAHSYSELSPSIIANYSYQLAQTFNEFYHNTQVLGSDNEKELLSLVDSFSQVLKNALNLLGIEPLERM